MNNHIKNTFRNVITLTLFITGAAGFQGCEKLLEQENVSQLSSDNLLTTEQGLETVMADS